MKDNFHKGIQRGNMDHCKPNALDIMRDICHGLRVAEIRTKHHVNQQAVFILSRALENGASIAASQLALYRTMNRSRSGQIKGKSLMRILKDSMNDAAKLLEVTE